MKKFRLRDYLPVLIMVLCAAIFGVLLATGVMDLDLSLIHISEPTRP